MAYRTTENRIIIDPEEAAAKQGSVFIPDAIKVKPGVGIIKYIGPDVVDLVIGDKILFEKNSGTTININGKEYTSIRDNDVYGTLS